MEYKTNSVSEIKAPWLSFYGNVPESLNYPEGSMADMVESAAKKYPNYLAYEFMGTKVTYEKFVAQIHECAKALKAFGIKEGERVTVCLPNCPQGVIMFYAINVIGAIGNMIHPLSSIGEIEFYLKDSNSAAVITLDQFYGKFADIMQRTEVKKLIITSVRDFLNPIMKLGYNLTEGKKVAPLPENGNYTMWADFLAGAKNAPENYHAHKTANDPAVILYSGGTTGTTKGILLSNLNFNALATQIVAVAETFKAGDTMLAVMPIFHGFGLGVCIHSMLGNGGKSILIARFTPKTYAQLIKKRKPNYIAGVPTLYEALLRNPDMDNANLSHLKGVFSGGDSLSVELKKKFDAFLTAHNASIAIREGYGTTECVTASCLTPYNMSREGSIGIPFPDTFYKIVKPGTIEEVEYGTEGEITLTGPSLMIEYVNHPDETASTLRRHSDGHTWLHTGDLGMMDKDGFVYFRQRIKRMIVTSGYNVYPSQLENIMDAHELVHMSCFIGVPDPYKMQKVKAFVMLKPGIPATDDVKKTLMEHCRRNIAKYAMPYDIEFREELPKTLVGKVAYRVLEAEELAKISEAAAASN